MSFIRDYQHDMRRNHSAKMERIDKFCRKNGIRHSNSGDSYYFILDGKRYRISNHSMESSNRHAYRKNGSMKRRLYHDDYDVENTIYIYAGRNKIVGVYKKIKKNELKRKKSCGTILSMKGVN